MLSLVCVYLPQVCSHSCVCTYLRYALTRVCVPTSGMLYVKCVCTYLRYALTRHPLNQLCTATAARYSTSRCLSASLHTRLPINNELKPPQRSICQIARVHDASLVICIFRCCSTHFHFHPNNDWSIESSNCFCFKLVTESLISCSLVPRPF